MKDNDLLDSIKDALVDSNVKGAEEIVKRVMTADVGEHPDSLELNELKSKLQSLEEEREAERNLSVMVDELAEAKGITKDEALQVRKFAEELYEQKGTLVQLDDAYDLWTVRKGSVVVKKRQPSVPKTPSAKRGGKPKQEGSDHLDENRLFI